MLSNKYVKIFLNIYYSSFQVERDITNIKKYKICRDDETN
jgi:hypothetical protein